jgi:prephenate dehydratase
MNETGSGRALSIAFQGELGAYSQSAVYEFFGRKGVRVVPLATLQEVFRNLFTKRRPRPDLAVVPIENSTAGSVGETIDFLAASRVRIVGETSIPIHHCLMTNRGTRLEEIRRVLSHPQALSQCRNFLALEGRHWQQIPTYDTAGSAKMISEQRLAGAAAIAGELAAEIYGMTVVRKNIEDDHTNTTRFIVVEASGGAKPRERNEPSGEDKTTVIFFAKHKPGSLVRALDCFSSRGINLLKIESRPIRGKPWEYLFYIDVEGHVEERECSRAMADLRSRATKVKLLGSYPKARNTRPLGSDQQGRPR